MRIEDSKASFFEDKAVQERFARRLSGNERKPSANKGNYGSLLTGKVETTTTSPLLSSSPQKKQIGGDHQKDVIDYTTLTFDPIYAKVDPDEKNPLLGGTSGRTYHDVNMFQFYAAPKRRIQHTIQEYQEPPESAEISKRTRKMYLPTMFGDSDRNTVPCTQSKAIELPSLSSHSQNTEGTTAQHSKRPHLSSGKFSRRLLTTIESASSIIIYVLLLFPLVYTLLFNVNKIEHIEQSISTSLCGQSYDTMRFLSCKFQSSVTERSHRLLQDNITGNSQYGQIVEYSFRIALSDYNDSGFSVTQFYLQHVLPAFDVTMQWKNVTEGILSSHLFHVRSYLGFKVEKGVEEKYLLLTDERDVAIEDTGRYAMLPCTAAHDYSTFIKSLTAVYYHVSISIPHDDRALEKQPIQMKVRLTSPTTMYEDGLLSVLQACILFIMAIYFSTRIIHHAKHHFEQTKVTLNEFSDARSYNYVFGAIFTRSHFVLPEQYLIAMALFFMVGCFDPIGNISILLWWNSANEVSGHHNILGLIGDVVAASSVFGVYFIIVSCLDGLKYHSNQYEERRLLHTTRDLLHQQGYPTDDLSVSITSGRGGGYGQQSNTSPALLLLQSLHNIYILPYHPRSALFLDFIWKKMACLMLSILFQTLYLCLLYAEPSKEEISTQFASKRTIIFYGKYILLLIHVGWIASIVKVSLTTNEALKGIRYIPSRLRQIAFHLLHYQVFVGITVYVVYAAVQTWSHSMLTSTKVFNPSEVVESLWKAWIWWSHQDLYLLLITSSSLHCLRWMTYYVVGMVLCFALAFSPIFKEEFLQVGDDEWELQSYIPLERDLHMKHFGRKLPFCLETACFLLEASYQTYFPLQNDSLSFRIGPQLDLSRLGLQLQEIFLCSQFHTFGFLSNKVSSNGKAEKIVISFRGSTMENLATDFRFSQIPLPVTIDHEATETKVTTSHHADYVIVQQSIVRDIPYFLKLLRMKHQLANAELGVAHTDCHHDESDFGSANYSQETKHKIPLFRQSYPRVHVGFWEAYCSIRESFLNGIVFALCRYYERHLHDLLLRAIEGRDAFDSEDINCHIFFCGHSLGAAMATLAALEFSINFEVMMQAIFIYLLEMNSGKVITHSNGMQRAHTTSLLSKQLSKIPHPKISYYGYGSPRVGNQSFAALCQSHIPNSYRIAVFGDIVTKVPKILGFYRHIGIPVILDDNETGDILIKPSILEQYFYKNNRKSNNSTVTDGGGSSISNHSLEKYRTCLEACFSQQEFEQYLRNEEKAFPLVDA